MRDRRLRRLAVAFVLTLVAADLGARLVGAALPERVAWYHHIADVKARQLAERRGAELDMVFAGTSQTYYGIDVAVIDDRLGTSSYNAGLPAGVPPIQASWLPDHVLRRVDTDLVVWGVSMIDLNDRRDLSVVSAYQEAPATRRGLLPTVDRLLGRWSGLFRHRRQLTDPEIWRQALRGEDTIEASRRLVRDDGVRVHGDRRPTERQRRRMRNRIVGEFTVGGEMLESFRSTITQVRASGVEVVLAWLPVPDRLLELLDDPQVERDAQLAMQDLAGELGVRLIDVSDGFADHHFLDYTHLGPTGAQLLSARLAEELGRVDPGPGTQLAAPGRA